MKKIFSIFAVVLGTYAFTACNSTAESEEGQVIDSETVVEADTTIEQTIVETDTVTRTEEVGSGTDTIQ